MPIRNDAQLMRDAQAGRNGAVEALFRAELPPLRRWAHAHVPAAVRRAGDTDDYVQMALLRTLRRLPYLKLGDQVTLQPYLRRVLGNLVRDQARLIGRRPPLLPIDDEMLAAPASQEDALRAAETFDRYRAAITSLSARERTALTARLHRHWDYARVARSAGCPSQGAARVMVGRALAKVATHMKVRPR